MIKTSEASWSSPVTIENSLNSMLKLQSHCTPLATLKKGNRMSGGNVESRGRSGALHSPGTENASMLLTPSKRHSAMLQSWLYQSPNPEIACTSMQACMHRAWLSARCKSRPRSYWVISAVNSMMRRCHTPHMTENYWASKAQYYTGYSTYTQLSNHFWYTQTMRPCIGSSHNHTSPYIGWIS